MDIQNNLEEENIQNGEQIIGDPGNNNEFMNGDAENAGDNEILPLIPAQAQGKNFEYME